MSTADIAELLPAVKRDIPEAIRELESIRTNANRDTIVWTQYVLSACHEIVKHYVKTA